MANTFSIESAAYFDTATPTVADYPASHEANLRIWRCSIVLAGQASGDTITLARIPTSQAFVRGWLTSDTSLGAATVAIGTAAVPAKYRTAATFTATNTPTPFGLTSAKANAAALPGAETVILTIAAAALPSSGNLVVDLEFSGT